MVEALRQFIQQQHLFSSEDQILLAISGGLDSVALGHLLRRAGYSIGLAHCQFQLREDASEQDAKFVQELAKSWNVPFFVKRFDTKQLAAERGESIQVTARQLRYEWLETVRSENDFAAIATAHHQTDALETFLFNFANGSGIQGLQGIPLKRGHIVRPLLFTTRQELEAWVEKEGIAYREDASNATLDYDRNRIRHQVLPVLRTVNPGFDQAAARTLSHLQESAAWQDWAINYWTQKIRRDTQKGWRVSIERLQEAPAPGLLLFSWLGPHGFKGPQIRQILNSLDSVSACFKGSEGRLLVDREDLIFEGFPVPSPLPLSISGPGTWEVPGGQLQVTSVPRPKTLDAGILVAYIPQEKLDFPVQLRGWRTGDYFFPLGMKGHRKKVQDLFTDLKLSLFDKEKVLILSVEGQIVWILGLRQDNRYRVLPETGQCWKFEFIPSSKK
jgi:tRNA(Ile)-lysidine synthase